MMFVRGRFLHLVSALILVLSFRTSYAGILSGYFLQPGITNINLTTEGTRDWAHWGLATASDFNRKNIANQSITNFTLIGGPAGRVPTNQISFNWSDGTPTISGATVTSGVFVTNVADGFHITMPADTTARRLRLYVGASAGQGELLASLSDTNAPDYDDLSMSSAFDLQNGIYTINYQAGSTQQMLTVNFTVSDIFNTGGFVSLNAATVTTNKPPTVSITSPTNNTPFFVTQDVPITATASDIDGTITLMKFYDVDDSGTNFIDETSSNTYTASLQGISAGTNVLTVVAYDNDGGITVSAPITLVVKTNPPPVIAITRPTADTNFFAPANIT